MNKKNKVLYWLPRLLAAAFVGFITIFSFDVFGTGESWWLQAFGFLMHSIPSLLCAGALALAWKNGRLGGIIFIILAFSALIIFRNGFAVFFMFPLLLAVGLLFWAEGRPGRAGRGDDKKAAAT